MKNKNKIRKNEIQRLEIEGFIQLSSVSEGDILSFENGAKSIVIQCNSYGENAELVIAKTTDDVGCMTSFKIVNIYNTNKYKRKLKIWERK